MNTGRDMAIAEAKARIAAEKVEQDRALGMKMLFDAKRENVALQLEAAYREQLVKVFSEVNYQSPLNTSHHLINHFYFINL